MNYVYRNVWWLFCKVWALLLLLWEKCNKAKTLYNLCTDPFTYTLVIQRMKWLKSCPIKMCFLNNYGGRIKTEIGNKRTNILYCITFYVRQFWMRKIIPSFHSCYLLCMHFICQMARCIMFLFMRTYYIIFYFSLHCMRLLMCILLYFHHNMQLILAMISLYLFYCLYQVTSSYYFKEHVVLYSYYSQRCTS